MKKLLNTLYVFTDDAYLSLDGENVVVSRKTDELGRVPLHTVEAVMCFSYRGASPALLGACAERGIAFSFYDSRGRFLAGVHGVQRGNVLLRRKQFRVSEDEAESVKLARHFILGKVFNCRWVLERALRDHAMRIDSASVKAASISLKDSCTAIAACENAATLRGLEGDAAASYFKVFEELILRSKDDFAFPGRVRRPPTDPVNAMLSLFYTVLARDCAAALEGVGLDPYMGFLHVDRPGRQSLALDLMEELRPIMVDRFVITAVNNQIVKPTDFTTRETGEVRINDAGRKALFEFWQQRKKEQITHPYLAEKLPWGLVPHVQALLLARFLRDDLDGYPPFLWK